MRTLSLRIYLVFFMCFNALLALAQTPVSYKVAYDPSTAKYVVYMKTSTQFNTVGSPSSQIGTAQASIVIPHGMATNLTAGGSGVTSINGTWSLNTRLDAPTENPSKDYLFFSYSTSTKFAMPANTDIALFSFATSNCLGSIALYDNATDLLQVPNIENANPGNSMSILGNGGEAYGANYGGAVACPVATSPDLTTTTGPIPALTAGQQAIIPVTVNNIGTAPAVGPITTTFTVPTGITPPTSPFTSNGWSCSVNLQVVSCTNPNTIPTGAGSVISVPVTPTASVVGTTPVFNATTAPVTGETNTTNNVAPSTSPSQPVAAAVATNLPLSYKIAYDSNTGKFTVYMKTTIAYSATVAPSSQIGTAQASVVVPHGMFPNLVPGGSGITSLNGNWNLNTRVNAPTENPSKDYLFFSYSTSAKFEMPANTDIPLFCFTSTNCLGSLAMYDITTDPLQVPNVENANPGNNMSILGNNGEAYFANYGGPAICIVTTPDLVTTSGPIPALTAGQQAIVPVTVSNIGTAPAVGPITAIVTIPAGVTPPSAPFVSNGWSCSVNLQVVSCTNPNTIANGASSTFNVPVTPTASTIGTSPVFTATTTPVSGETNTANNVAPPVSPTSPVVAATAPDLTIVSGPVPALTAGQQAIVPVTVSNIGTAPAVGPITAIVTIPAGVTPPSAPFVSNGWSCSVNLQVVSCTNPSTIVNGASSTFNVPVTPTASTIGTSPEFTATTTPVSGETNTANNTAPPASPTSPVVAATAPDLVTTSGPVPALTAGQQAIVPVTVSNIGTAPAVGPITAIVTIPAGVTPPSAPFVSNGWSCSVNLQVVSCTNPSTIANGASSTFNVPVTPTASTIGTSPVFTATTTPVSGETNTANNTAPPASPTSPVVAATVTCTTTDCGVGVRYGLKLGADGITYTVYMKSANAYAGNFALIATAQATVVLPTGTQIANPVSLQSGMTWLANTRINHPIENTSSDYVSFGFSQSASPSLFVIPAETEISLFSFQRTGLCIGSLKLIDTADAFQGVSTSTNPGNQITIIGNGMTNAWQCNYTCPSACPTAVLSLVKTSSTSTIYQNTPYDYNFTVTNTGTSATVGTITVTDVLPAGLQYVSATGTGWTCGAIGQTVTCNYLASIAVGSSKTLSITVNPTQLGAVSNSATVSGGGTSGTIASTPCATCPVGPTSSTVLINPVDLTVTIAQPGTLTVGQVTTVNVTVSNIAVGTATAPLISTISFSNGVTAPASFNGGNGWVCTTVANQVSCTNATNLAGNQSSVIAIPITPSTSNAGQSLLLLANVVAVAGETNLGNNSSFIFTNTNVQASDLTITVGPVPALSPSQTSLLPITINNIGQAAATGALTVQVTLPSGISLNNAQLPANWSLVSSSAGANGSTVLTLTTPNTGGLASGGSLIMNLPIVPTNSLTGTITFLASVNPIVSESNTNNNSGSVSGIIGATDLTITIVAPSAVIVGQTSNFVVTISNIGVVATTGALSVQVTLPTGATLGSALPVGWVLQSSTINLNGSTTVILVNNTATLSPSGQVIFNLPVVFGSANANQVTNIAVNVLQLVGEINTSNNQASVNVTPTAPQISVVITPPVSLTGGQSSNITIILNNTGNVVYTGPITTQITLSAGVSVGALPSGWVIQSQVTNPNGSITYVLLNSNVTLPIGGNVQFVVPVTPSTTLNGQNVSIVVVTPTIPGFTTPTTTQTVNLIVLAPSTSYITVVVGNPSPALTVGQNSIIPITFTNIGTVASSSVLNVQVTLPAGVVLNQSGLPAGWVVTSSTAGANGSTVIVLTNTGAMIAPNGGQLVLNVPVFTNSGASNTTPTFNIVVIGQPTSGVIPYVVTQPITSPNIVIVVGQPTPNLVVGQTSIIPITISNTGNGIGYGPFNIQLTLPSGVTLGTLPSGWAISSTVNNVNGSTTITITNPNTSGIAPSTSIVVNIPITPGSSVVNTTPTIIVIVSPISGFTNPINQTIVIINPVQQALPDLLVVVNQPSPSLVAGQTSNVAVVISNLGNINITGSLSVQVTLPAGVVLSPSQLPVGWVLATQTSNVNGSITYTLQNSSVNILQGQSITINVPITPNTATIGTNPVILVYVVPVANEVIVINNSSSITVNIAVQSPPAAPDLAIVIPAQSWTLQTGQTTNITFNVINIGTQSAGSPLSVTFTLPANFTTNPTAFTTNGWTCTTTGTQVACTIAAGLNVGSQVTLVIPVTPTALATGMVNPSFVINVTQASGEVSLINNTGIINYIGVIQSLVPDLAVSIPAQSWALGAGQTTNMTFNVSNIGTAIATAPLSLTFTMPANFTTNPSTFVTNLWLCNTVGSVVTCSYSSNYPMGTTTSLVIPVQPLNAAGGLLNPSFVINVVAATGEVVLTNNIATINYVGAVQAGSLLLNVKALLQGSFEASTGLLRDDLRTKNLIPLAQPYISTPGMPAYTFINSGTETTTPAILAVTGNNAIVDWVMVELRNLTNPAALVASKPALIQRDGDIVSAADGISAVAFPGIAAGSYYVVVRHRNHLGVMSASPIALSTTAVTTDLTAMSNLYKIASYGNYPANVSGTKALMWAGNTNGDDKVVFQGPNTDVDGSFFTVITDTGNTGLVTNFINSGYRMSDINMDGKTIFQGPTNEPDIIFFNVILHPENTTLLPNFIIKQHLPQ